MRSPPTTSPTSQRTTSGHAANDFVLGCAPRSSNILFASDRAGTVDAWVIGLGDGKPDGPPRLVKKEIGRIQPFGFTSSGSFFYGVFNESNDVYLAKLDPRTHRLTAPVQANEQLVGTGRFPHWSPDGENLVFQARDPMDKSPAYAQIFSIRSLTTGKERRIKPEVAGFNLGVRWSPDGKSFLGWGWDKKGPRGIYRFDAQTGAAENIVRSEPGVSAYLPSWLPDGKAILYRRSDETTKTESLISRDLESGKENTIARVGFPSWIPSHAVSPDGRMLAFVIREDGSRSSTLKTAPLAGGAEREIVKLVAPESIGFARALTWTRDGRSILFVNTRGTSVRSSKSEVWRVPAEGGKPEPTGLSWQGLIPGISLHPDGERLAFTAASLNANGEIWVMENFLPESAAAK